MKKADKYNLHCIVQGNKVWENFNTVEKNSIVLQEQIFEKTVWNSQKCF